MNRTRTIILSVAFVFAGCLEYHTTTTVRDDGSLLRTVAIRGDSLSTLAWDFAVAVDTTWTWERARTGDREWTLTLRREFASTDAFNAYQAGFAGSVLRSKVTVERSFRWFTTRFRYREVLPSVNPFRSIPLSDYLSSAELDMFLDHEVQKKELASARDSLAVENASDRFEAWARRNEFEALFGAIRTGVERLGDRTFTPESLDARHSDLTASYEALRDTGDVFDEKDFRRRKEAWLKQRKEAAMRRAAVLAYDSLEAIESRMAEMHRLMEFPHKATVVMPGLLTGTNARSIEGSSARWEDYLIVMYFQDFTFEAESVVTNWWAVVVTGLLAVGAPVAWFLSRRRRR
ncbi:MAG: hypothetical protein MUE68_09300 [Bacteroidetes bacterium]|jgi:hypothetical protein|nr:hypothetical protein [Bacteroidota bacterium]